MSITEEEKRKILDFYKACDDMIDGRFILSDTKVSNILKTIVQSEVLYNLYSVCMKDFKFRAILDRSLAENPANGGYFQMTSDPKEIVAFVTCLLLEVDKKNISLQNFVTENFFSADGYNISYNNFSLVVLVAYKNAVKMLVHVDENGNIESEENVQDNQITMQESMDIIETDKNTKLLLANLLMNIQDLENMINEESRIKYSEKEELIIVCKALKRAVDIEELLIINALLVPFEHLLKKHRKLNNVYENIKLLIADIYY